MNEEGISAIVCCYNSGWIIERTLVALCTQQTDSINYEIIIVNNCSNDNTYEIAKRVTDRFPHIATNIVYEENAGLMYARKKGISISQYSYLLFCDDDNILCNNYVISIFKLMQSDKHIGACGGYGLADFYDCEKPIWFDAFQACYATGKQNTTKHELYGAGCCYRREAMNLLSNNTVKPFLTGRKGNMLLAGDDSEIAKSICIVGYKLSTLNDITFKHVLPLKRLNEKYLCNMVEGFGISYLPLYMYDCVIEKKSFNRFTYVLRLLYFSVKCCFHYIQKLILKDNIFLSTKYYLAKGVLKSYRLFDFKSLIRAKRYYSNF